MTASDGGDLVASVRGRLLNLSRRRGEDFQYTLIAYATERFLYRLARSGHRGMFVLKGARLLEAWTERRYRPTRDLDLLGFGDLSEATLRSIFGDICSTVVEPDGLQFDAEGLGVEPRREEQAYPVVRVRLDAVLGAARIVLWVDIGVGDAVVPPPEDIAYPVLLEGLPAPHVRAYSMTALVAEKLHAMVVLGIANSRMRDFYDVFLLAHRFPFGGLLLAEAICATFRRRGTDLPARTPLALTTEFARDRVKRTQWAAFLGRTGLDDAPDDLSAVVADLYAFLWPPLEAARDGRPFECAWGPAGPWKIADE